ncbi:DEAD/DEAH box helicase [Vibrio breoganii]
MLKEIISNLSYSDKYHLLSEEQLEFISNLSETERNNLDLSNIIYHSLGIKLLVEPQSCALIIERMKREQVRVVIENLNIEGLDYDSLQSQESYEVLRVVSEQHPELFFQALGLGESLEEYNVLKERVQGTIQNHPSYPMYDYQIDCANRVKNYIDSTTDKRVLLHLPTGAGKTRTSMNVVCDFLRENPNELVVWLADTKELCEQAVQEFQKAWGVLGNHSLPSYCYFGDSELSISGLSKGFLVASLQKLSSLGKQDKNALDFLYKELRKKTSLVVFDEAHKAIAPTYERTVELFLNHSENNAFLIGLSATPGRVMGDDEKMHLENKKLSDFFHNNKVTMTVRGYSSPLEYLVDEQYLADAEFIQLNYDDLSLSNEFTLESRSTSNSSLMKALSSNDNRNLKLIETITHEIENNSSQIIVFACTVAHANELTLQLNGIGVSCQSIDGGTPSIVRAAAISDYKRRKINVLINYGVLTAGFDAPCTNVAIIARPTNSLVQYSQMAGRAMRGKRSGGNTNCRVYTVNDNIPEFRNVCHAFSYWDQMWKPE